MVARADKSLTFTDLENLLQARTHRAANAARAEADKERQNAIMSAAADITGGKIKPQTRELRNHQTGCSMPDGCPCCDKKKPTGGRYRAFADGVSAFCDAAATILEGMGFPCTRDIKVAERAAKAIQHNAAKAQQAESRQTANEARELAITQYVQKLGTGEKVLALRPSQGTLLCGAPDDCPCCKKDEPAVGFYSMHNNVGGICKALAYFFRQARIYYHGNLASAKDDARAFLQPGGTRYQHRR
ncbi:MAG: hypothetical protein AAB692_06160 [Patescibacteria group bacterium]